MEVVNGVKAGNRKKRWDGMTRCVEQGYDFEIPTAGFFCSGQAWAASALRFGWD